MSLLQQPPQLLGQRAAVPPPPPPSPRPALDTHRPLGTRPAGPLHQRQRMQWPRAKLATPCLACGLAIQPGERMVCAVRPAAAVLPPMRALLLSS